MIDRIKPLRVEIDRVTKQAQALAKDIDRGQGGREIALAITKLQEAKMWAGQSLVAMDHKLPPEYRDES